MTKNDCLSLRCQNRVARETCAARGADSFPIGLFIAGVVFDILGRLSKRRQLITAAYYNLTAAALFMVPTVITGILAWQWALDGQKLKGILLMHLVWACVSSALLWAIALIRFRSHRNLEAVLPNYCLLLEACAVLIVIVTAHLGGFLSGVNGS